MLELRQPLASPAVSFLLCLPLSMTSLCEMSGKQLGSRTNARLTEVLKKLGNGPVTSGVEHPATSSLELRPCFSSA